MLAGAPTELNVHTGKCPSEILACLKEGIECCANKPQTQRQQPPTPWHATSQHTAYPDRRRRQAGSREEEL